MGTRTVTAVSICSGIGGLELGVRLVVPGLRVIAYVERDVPAAAVLARRMDDGALDAAPIWSDVTRFDGERWAGSVDIVMGGIPCQPFSVAGQRKGRDDERWIWPDIWRWVRAVRPAIVFLENVPGFIRHGLPVVLDDLAEAGFDAEWGCFRASDVGAPHRRERVFVLGVCQANAERQQLRQQDGTRWGAQAVLGSAGPSMADANHERQPALAGGAQHAATFSGGVQLADTESGGLGGDGCAPRNAGHIDQRVTAMADTGHRFVPIEGRGAEGRNGAGPAGADVGDAQGVAAREPGNTRVWHEYGDQTCGGVGATGRLFPPGPGDRAEWRRYLGEGGAEPAIRRGADGTAGRLDDGQPTRNQRLHMLGNAVVPQCAAVAFLTLADALGLDLSGTGA